MSAVPELLEWLLINPARLMVLVSIGFTLFIGLSELGGTNTGGSGWLTLLRLATGACFSLITALVAGWYGGIGAALGYFLLQVLICLVIPVLIVDKF